MTDRRKTESNYRNVAQFVTDIENSSQIISNAETKTLKNTLFARYTPCVRWFPVIMEIICVALSVYNCMCCCWHAPLMCFNNIVLYTVYIVLYAAWGRWKSLSTINNLKKEKIKKKKNENVAYHCMSTVTKVLSANRCNSFSWTFCKWSIIKVRE